MRTFHPPSTTTHVDPVHRALEGIKDKLQLLSEPSGASEHTEKEGDMNTVCDLADGLRDAIVEYQVSIDIEQRTGDSSFMQLIGRAAGGNLQAELQIDCELQDPRI